MFLLWIGLMVFFAYRSWIYFSNDRAAAGVLAGMACLLFMGAIYVQVAERVHVPGDAQPVAGAH